jgi:hypothetical protein
VGGNGLEEVGVRSIDAELEKRDRNLFDCFMDLRVSLMKYIVHLSAIQYYSALVLFDRIC